MKISLSTLIFAASGRPSSPKCEAHDGLCWLCGADMQLGLVVSEWAGEGFNAYARAQRRADTESTHVCDACTFVSSRVSPVPGRPPKDGKKFGGNFRNYSHGAELLPNGEVDYVNASKAETPVLVSFLDRAGSRGPWALALATSGQKHVIPYAPVNAPGAAVVLLAFEDLIVRADKSTLSRLIAVMNEVRRASLCSAEAIASGTYHPKDLARAMPTVVAFEREYSRMRGGGVFEVAAFLTSKAP